MDNRINEICKELRELGCAIVCFVPEELRGVDPYDVEERLVEEGWDVIDSLAEEDEEDDE